MTRTYRQMHRKFKYSEHSSIIWPVSWNGWVFGYQLYGFGLHSSYCDLKFKFCACIEFLDSQATIECGFTIKDIRDMKRTDSQMHGTDKYSEHSWIIWPLWPNGWVFVYELSGYGFHSCFSHLTFRFSNCFKEGFPWHSGRHGMWIHSETCTWLDKNIQSNAQYR